LVAAFISPMLRRGMPTFLEPRPESTKTTPGLPCGAKVSQSVCSTASRRAEPVSVVRSGAAGGAFGLYEGPKRRGQPSCGEGCMFSRPHPLRSVVDGHRSNRSTCSRNRLLRRRNRPSFPLGRRMWRASVPSTPPDHQFHTHHHHPSHAQT